MWSRPKNLQAGRKNAFSILTNRALLRTFNLLAPVVQKPVRIGVDEILVSKNLRHIGTPDVSQMIAARNLLA
jgi:hypothetical protein